MYKMSSVAERLTKEKKLLPKNIPITKFIQYLYTENLLMKIMLYG